MWDYWVECWCRAVDASRRYPEGFCFALNCRVRGVRRPIQNREIKVEHRVQESESNRWLDEPRLQTLLRSEICLPICCIVASAITKNVIANFTSPTTVISPRLLLLPFSCAYEVSNNSKHSQCQLPSHTIYHTRDLTFESNFAAASF